MIIGAILQTSSYSYAQMIVARIVTGLGNGLNVSLLAAWSASNFLTNPLLRRHPPYPRTMQNARQPHNEEA